MQEMQKMRVLSPGQEGPLEESMANSCLKNWMDRGAWWATVHRVTKSWTPRLKWLSMHALDSLSWGIKNFLCHQGKSNHPSFVWSGKNSNTDHWNVNIYKQGTVTLTLPVSLLISGSFLLYKDFLLLSLAFIVTGVFPLFSNFIKLIFFSRILIGS